MPYTFNKYKTNNAIIIENISRDFRSQKDSYSIVFTFRENIIIDKHPIRRKYSLK